MKLLTLPEILGPSDAGYTTVLIELYSDFDESWENGAFTASKNAIPIISFCKY